MTSTVLIAGASGLVGAAAVNQFLDDGWDVVAVSRRKPEIDSHRAFRHLPIDLQAAGRAVPLLRRLLLRLRSREHAAAGLCQHGQDQASRFL
ncbi:MAG TPA: NAD-dependent epimerase/dehydratase family protein [Chloroflexota bacterium]|nr:NAD-dependent epimerase/dehydratase family protein [Chloroflexota bacterium]